MKKPVVLLALLLIPMLASCAYPAAHNTVRPVTGYIPAQDDGDKTCLSPLLAAVSVADSVWARCEWWQSGSLIKRDSLKTPRGVWLVFTPPVEVPNATKVTSTVYLRDIGGTSCAASMNQTPTISLIPPASFSGLSIVP